MEKSMSFHHPNLKMTISHSLPKIINTNRTKRIKFQNLYESGTSFNKNNKQDIQFGSTSDFFARNYDNYLSKINRRRKFYNSRLMTEDELNSLLYKLKSYYSEVISINNKKEDSLIALREALNFEQFKLNQLIEFQDIELPDEKISVRNFNELKLTKNEVEKILRNLLKEKQYLDELLKNAGEYFKTIGYMCEDEKNRFMEIKKETNLIEERINNVKQYQRIIDYNLGKNKIKNEEEKEINIKLKQDIELVEKVNNSQKHKNEKLDKIILEKEKKVEELKNKLLELKKQNKKQNDLYKNDIQQQIEKAKEYSEDQKKREKKLIEIVYCLCVLQNYFINEEDFDRENMQSSIEYKLLINNKFDIDFNKKQKTLNKGKITSSPHQTLSEKNESTDNKIDNNEENSKTDKEDEKNVEEEKNVEKDQSEIDFQKIKERLAKKLSLKNKNYPLINFEKEEQKPKLIRPISTKNKSHVDLIKYMNNKVEKKENEKNEEENKNKDNKESENNKIANNSEDEEKKSKNEHVIKMVNTFTPNNKMANTKGSMIIASTHSNNNYSLLSLEELKEKFESIKINKKILFDYNSKLTSELNFFKTQFDNFHNKELILEEKKSLFTKKATQVISEDYLTFTQLAKINPKIKEFLINNSEIIEEIHGKNKKKKLNEIGHQIKQSNPISNIKFLENSKSTYQIDDQLNNNSNLIISSSENIIRSNKNFFMRCNDYLKQIINAIETINNFDRKENEKKKNINDNENMSDLDSKENKDNKENKDKKDKDSKEKEEKSETSSEIDQEFTKVFTEESEKLDNLIKTMEEKMPNDKNTFVNYIKDLINFSQKNEKLREIFGVEELNNDLLYQFYKDPEGKKIKSTFYTQFQIKKFPELKDIYNHFTIYVEPTIENIKQIIKIINDTEKNSDTLNIINLKNNKIKKKNNLLSSKNINKNLNIYQEKLSNENKDKIINLRYNFNQEKNKLFQGFDSGNSQKNTSYSELEFMGRGKIDEDDIFDNQVEKKEKKIIRKKVNSIEENIVNKLYSPFLQKTSYLRKLNKNLKGIKSMTTNNCKANHTLRKRIGEVDIITHQMLIYNNPLVNPDKLAEPTYNSLVKLAISSQNENKNDKRFKSTFTPQNKVKKQI